MLKSTLLENMVKSGNPVFEYDLRKIRWFQRGTVLRQYGLRWLMALYIVLFLGLLALRPWSYSRRGLFLQIGGVFDVNLLNSVASFLYIAADVFFVMSSITAINRQKNSGNWDLLMLTTMDRQSIIDAKYSAATLRSWRVMLLNRAFQTGLALYTVMRFLGPALTSGFFYFSYRPAAFWLSAFLGLVFAWFIPLWRMRAMTAASIAISSSTRSVMFAVLSGLGAAATLQVGLNAIGTTARTLLPLAMGAQTARISPYTANFDYATFAVLSGLLIYGGTFVLCWAMQQVALRYALKTAFAAD
jgi:hypothetical protein